MIFVNILIYHIWVWFHIISNITWTKKQIISQTNKKCKMFFLQWSKRFFTKLKFSNYCHTEACKFRFPKGTLHLSKMWQVPRKQQKLLQDTWAFIFNEIELCFHLNTELLHNNLFYVLSLFFFSLLNFVSALFLFLFIFYYFFPP